MVFKNKYVMSNHNEEKYINNNFTKKDLGLVFLKQVKKKRTILFCMVLFLLVSKPLDFQNPF